MGFVEALEEGTFLSGDGLVALSNEAHSLEVEVEGLGARHPGL